MKREMGSGLRLDQMRGFMKTGRWHWSVICWPHLGRWVLTVSAKGNRDVPYHYLEAEKSGQPRLMTSETALRIAEELSVDGVYFQRRPFESVSPARGSYIREKPTENRDYAGDGLGGAFRPSPL